MVRAVAGGPTFIEGEGGKTAKGQEQEWIAAQESSADKLVDTLLDSDGTRIPGLRVQID